MMDKKIVDAFLNVKSKAEKVAKDTEAAATLVDKAKKKAEKNKGFAKKMRDDLHGLFRMVRTWSQGKYSLPWKTIVTAIAALLYFVNPLDLIPDFIIGTGLLDDASIIAYAFNIIRKDVEAFTEWEKSANTSQNTDPS